MNNYKLASIDALNRRSILFNKLADCYLKLCHEFCGEDLFYEFSDAGKKSIDRSIRCREMSDSLISLKRLAKKFEKENGSNAKLTYKQ